MVLYKFYWQSMIKNKSKSDSISHCLEWNK